MALPIYNLEPAPGEVAAIGIVEAFLRLKFSSRLRPTDYGLTTRIEGLPQFTLGLGKPSETYFEYWGVPADHQKGALLPRRPFLTNPTRCDGPLTVQIRLRTWERPGEWLSGSGSDGQPLSGCGDLPFAPSVGLALETPVAETPTGVSVDLSFPEYPDAGERIGSQVRSARIDLPDGMAISLGAVDRLRACSDAQLALGSEEPARCPAASKVGTVEIGEPQLSAPLTGKVYIGEEHPDARFRLFVVARSGPTETKFVGTMSADPVSGRLSATLSDLPQTPLTHLLIDFDGGPGALMVAPAGCGPTSLVANLVPWSGGPAARIATTATVGPRAGRRCDQPAPFEPSLTTALSSRRAGHATTFATVIGRNDGEQSTDRFSIDFPPGLSAKLGSVPPCGDAAIAAAACPAASRVGSAFIDVGSGEETAELSGGAYLTGPYRKGPYGFAMIFNADVGPFHFGALSVRAAMAMDPLTSQVTVRTDSLPQSFQGIPIHLRRIGLEIDRPGFMTTPTSCSPKRVRTTIQSTAGLLAHPSGELSVRGCVDLPFHPSFALALTDRAELHRHGNPGLRISLRSHSGEANLRSTSLLLPPGLGFSSANLREICPRREAFKGNCPRGSKVGIGSGRTPLLGKPLHGSVYVVQPRGNGEPDLWAHLEGGGVELSVRSESVAKDGRIESRFEGMPDMPLSSFKMQFSGGKHGVLALDRNLCVGGRARHLSAPASFEAHSGALRQARIPVAIPAICKAG